MSSSKKTVVVTGGSRGIGKAVALQLAKAGHNVVALGRSKDDLEQVAREIGADDRTLALVCDVTKRDDIDQALNAAVQKFGSVDCWINNAGVGINKPAELLDDNDFDTMMMLNCKSALYVCQALFIVNMTLHFIHFRQHYPVRFHPSSPPFTLLADPFLTFPFL